MCVKIKPLSHNLKFQQKMVQHEDKRMGAKVRIFNNKHYKGKQAWLNCAKGENGISKSMFHVLVAMEKDGQSYLHEMSLSKKNAYILKDRMAVSFELAVLQEHPDVEKQMDELAMTVAWHRITTQETINNMGAILSDKIDEAANLLAANTNTKYFHTDFDCQI